MQRPWQIETFTLDAFPRCKAYLNGMGCRVDKYPLADYWAVTILADKFDDADFERAGIDYMRSTGAEILAAIEALFSKSRKQATKPATATITDSGKIQLMAFLGSRGVKTSMLKDDQEIWKCARILWPSIKQGGDLGDLVGQIRLFSKAKRKTANANLKKLPKEWLA